MSAILIMKTNTFVSFRHFVKDEIEPATLELERIKDEKSRRHLQKLVFTNLVDRFDSVVDTAILDNCREELLVEKASKNLSQQVTEAELLKLLLDSANLQSALETKLKDGLRNTVLRERHSKKLKVLFQLFRPNEECWNTPRVNIATGLIGDHITPQNQKKPYSICGFADWIYSRRNSIVHGAGAKKLLENDAKQLKELFRCTPPRAVRIKPASVTIAATFYQSVMEKLTT